MYYNNKLANSSNKPKTTWTIIKITNIKKNCKNVLMMKIDGKVTTHYQTIAKKFHHYYISVADTIINNKSTNNTTDNSNKINPLNYLYSTFKQSFTNMTTTYEIEKIIKELKSTKSCGYGEITVRILKISSPFIVSPLTYICNRMLRTGTFPDKLQFSRIEPMYKKSDKTLITNYRPISLLLFFSNFLILKSLYIHGLIQNFPDWCRHLYSSCGSAKHR